MEDWNQETLSYPLSQSDIFLALRLDCRNLSKKFEPDDEVKLNPILVFCNHPDNTSDVEGNCNIKRCPLLEKWAKHNP